MTYPHSPTAADVAAELVRTNIIITPCIFKTQRLWDGYGLTVQAAECSTLQDEPLAGGGGSKWRLKTPLAYELSWFCIQAFRNSAIMGGRAKESFYFELAQFTHRFIGPREAYLLALCSFSAGMAAGRLQQVAVEA